MAAAVARARALEGPSYVEAQTVRWPGSRPLWPQLLTGATDLAMAWDPSRIGDQYRPWHERQDAVLRSVRELLDAGATTEDRILELDDAARSEMAAAVTFALDSPYPAPEEALEDAYA
jgi:TPP-dependent pyruvate/acetoin dehydrogenase alpha subunit